MHDHCSGGCCRTRTSERQAGRKRKQSEPDMDDFEPGRRPSRRHTLTRNVSGRDLRRPLGLRRYQVLVILDRSIGVLAIARNAPSTLFC